MKMLNLFALLVISNTVLAADNDVPADVPADFSDVSTLAPDIQVHMAYLGDKNFVGRPVDGYESNRCYLQNNAANALVKAQQAAMEKGYTLWVFDCYRPQRAVNHFMRWAADLTDISTKTDYYPNLDKDKLVGEYIAEQSGHSRGSTLDLTLARQNSAGQWQPIDMGSPFDLFDPISNVGATGITKLQQANRQLLEIIMLSAGFKVYNMEWWHFTHQPPVYTEQYFDFVVK